MFAKKLIVIMSIFVVLYIIADFYVFLKTGAEPTELTIATFALITLELGNLKSIKNAKTKSKNKKEDEIC